MALARFSTRIGYVVVILVLLRLIEQILPESLRTHRSSPSSMITGAQPHHQLFSDLQSVLQTSQLASGNAEIKDVLREQQQSFFWPPPPPPPPSMSCSSDPKECISEPMTPASAAWRTHYTRALPLAEAERLWKPKVGSWLASNVGRIALPSQQPALRGCHGGCGTAGICDELFGVCHCSSGHTGLRCERKERRRCNPTDGRYMWSRCAGACDERYGHCYCGTRGAYSDRPLLQCEPIGIEKHISPWKLDARNQRERFPWEAIWGRSKTNQAGWCDANASLGEKPAASCACRYDGRDGYLCQHHVAMFCLNQCSLRGRCEHGFCFCKAGWWGVDCSIPTAAGASSSPSFSIHPGSPTNEQKKQQDQERSQYTPVARLRPLIYVYEMPRRFTTDLLQRRQDKLFCTHRTYLQRNKTQYAYGIYQGYVLELLLHEWLLTSPHRTLNPAEADWFYVPVYASCAMVINIFETPDTQPRVRFRAALASQLYVGAYEYVRHALPHWNASKGADHIWTFGYDEGACFAPKPIWSSMLISHWGNTMSTHNRCTTTYEDDRWDVPFDPPTGLPIATLIGGHGCYDPQKDIVLPSFRELTTFLPPDPRRRWDRRPNLFFFSGDLGSPPGSTSAGPHVSPNYSMGIRQAVFRAASNSRASDIQVVGHLPQDWWHVKYHARMHNSTFCGAFPGDGWSGGISSAIFAGCVPVIIMDGIEMPFENVLDYSAFSIRIAESDVSKLPTILRAIPSAEVERLRYGLHIVRSRFGYSSLAHNERRLSLAMASTSGAAPSETYLEALASHNEEHEDALQTVMRILLYRAAVRKNEA